MNPLERAFARMGARVEFGQLMRRDRLSGRMVSEDLALDVRQDRHGEYFLISRAQASTTELVVLDVQPRDRHLLLLSRSAAEKHRFLLGHDERDWFVADIPESTPRTLACFAGGERGGYFAPNDTTRRAAALPGIRVPGTGA